MPSSVEKLPPLISIALCTFNGQKYLAEQLSSILTQSYGNLEIIVCDDVSTDETIEIIEDFALADSRIKVYKNSVNLGFNKNFEKAMSLTSGQFIAISDQDDIWEREKISRLYESIKDNLLVFSNSSLIDAFGNALNEHLLQNFSLANTSFRAYLLHNYTTGHTSLFDAKFLKYILPLPESGYYDWWMGFIAFYHNKTLFLDEPLTRHRVHENSAIHTVFSDEKAHLHKELFNTNLNIHQLRLFLTYKNLCEEDQKIVSELIEDLETKKKKFSFRLFFKLIFAFDEYIVSKKKRSIFSKWNFARKYARLSS